MKILLTGSTGALGQYLSVYLADHLDCTVYITSRQPRQYARPNIVAITANAMNYPELIKLLQEQHFDLCIDFMIHPNVPAFAELSSQILPLVGHYIFLSSSRAYADCAELITEDKPLLSDVYNDPAYQSSNDYSWYKGKEEHVLQQGKHSNFTIIRPCIHFASRRLQLCTLEASVLLPSIFFSKPVVIPTECLKKTAPWAWSGNSAPQIGAIVANLDQCRREVFNIGWSEHLTWEQVAQLYAQLAGLSVIAVPTELLKREIYGMGPVWQLELDRLLNRRYSCAKVLSLQGAPAPTTFKSTAEALKLELNHASRLTREIPLDAGYLYAIERLVAKLQRRA